MKHRNYISRLSFELWQWKKVCERKCWPSESFNSVFVYVTLVLTIQLKNVFGLNTVLWHKAPTDYKYAWLFESTGGVQQPFCEKWKHIFLLGNWRNGCQNPKASCNSVLAAFNRKEGKVQHWQLVHHLLNHGFASKQKYAWINIPERLLTL